MIDRVQWHYTASLKDQWGYWATWLPGMQITLGQTDRIEDLTFIPEGHLDDFGIGFSADSDASPIDYLHSSKQCTLRIAD